MTIAVSGRLTVFGEHLVPDLAICLSIRVPYYLSPQHEATVPAHPQYRADLDGVAGALEALGFRLVRGIRGTLPLGYGLAASTVLTRVYAALHGLEPLDEVMTAVDSAVHGFRPSGLDLVAILRQRTGLYGAGGWRDAISPVGTFALLFPPLERRRTLQEVRAIVRRHPKRLVLLCGHLASVFASCGQLDVAALMDYAVLLAGMDVYSRAGAIIVRHFLSSGVPTKCIGGLYDKAVLAYWPAASPSEPVLRLIEGVARQVRGTRTLVFGTSSERSHGVQYCDTTHLLDNEIRYGIA